MKYLSRGVIAFVLVAFIALSAHAAIIPSIPYNLTNGSLADATQVMGNFNTIVTDANANAAHSGANSDITSLTGLTTPLAPNYGGTPVYVAGTTGGTANAQTLASTVPSNYLLTVGNMVTGIAGFTNTGDTTLNTAGTGLKSMRVGLGTGLTPLSGGEIVAGNSYLWYYDGTYQILMNPSPSVFKGIQTVLTTYGSATSPPTQQLRHSRGTFASPLAVATSDELGEVDFIGYDGTAFINSAALYAIVNGTVANGKIPTDVILTVMDVNGVFHNSWQAKADGTLLVPNVAARDNSTKAANTAYVDNSSKLVQTVRTINQTPATGTTQIPFDNTIPQQTEGDQFMTLAITPASASDKLVITINTAVGSNTASQTALALFQDATAGALAVTTGGRDASPWSSNMTMTYAMTAGTTSATTFKVRIGQDRAATTYFNLNTLFGGTAVSSIEIMEYTQ